MHSGRISNQALVLVSRHIVSAPVLPGKLSLIVKAALPRKQAHLRDLLLHHRLRFALQLIFEPLMARPSLQRTDLARLEGGFWRPQPSDSLESLP